MIIIADVSELTRKIKLPTDRVLSVNGDYQVDGIAFKLPTTYEGDFDFSSGAARVHWTGVDKVEHTNLLTDKDTSGRPLWIMPSELTQGGHGVIEFAISFVATDETAAVTKRWISDPVSFRNRRTVNGPSEDEKAEEETIYDRLASAIAAVRAAQASVDEVNEVLAGITNSSPVVVATVADLSGLDVTKHQLAIVRADGYLYYYDGSAWQKGIKYGSYELDTTLTESGKAADAAAVGAEVSAIKEDLSAVSNESIVSFETINILKDVTFVPGRLNNTNGVISGDANYQTSDFIPIDGSIVYVLKNVARYCAYDENKAYPSALYGDDKQTAIFKERSYIRVSVLNSNIDNVFVCEGEKYYPNEAEADSQPQKINVAGENFAPKMLSEIANADGNHFTTGENLFDVNGGYIYVLGQAQVAFDDAGVVNVNPRQFQDSLNRKYNGADIPDNGTIASTYFIPVQAGKYMFANYSYWGSCAYDSDKNYVKKIPAQQNAFIGYLVPEGVSYVRLNFCAQTNITATNRLHSFEEVKNIMVWQEDEAECTHPATTLSKQIDGSFVSPNYLDKVVPNMADSDFMSAMKCMTVREINRREHAWRFGNFNAYVGSRTGGYYLIRKMLMDNGIDFCGFEEMSGRATDIGTYLKSWQFADGFVSPKNESGKGTNALSIASRFEVQTWNTYTMTTVSGNKDCINARIRLPRYMDVYNPFRILSMYVIHPMVGANQQNLANELLSIIANDDSDYIVITSDTNSFGDTEESKVFWRVLEAGGFRPTIPITTKTVTQDNLSGASDAYPEKPWRHHSIDQIFISSNIDCVSYNVINTKDEYVGSVKNNTTTDGAYALSDHDFVYADLVFKDEVRQ